MKKEMTREEKMEMLLRNVALRAKSKRHVLIAKYKKQGSGNVGIELPNKFSYVFGQTIPRPQIVFPDGFMMDDLEFFDKAGALH